jgi:hypothetical protein
MKHAERFAIPLAAVMSLACLGINAAPKPSDLSLVAQVAHLPPDFKDQFFGLPRAMRIEIDGVFLSDAMGVLTRDGEVQLIEWMEQGSAVSGGELARWLQALSRTRPLGPCALECDGVVALHYDLQTSTLLIATSAAEHRTSPARHYRLPERGGAGLIVHNALNIAGGSDTKLAARYTVDLIGSVGQWTAVGTLLGAQSVDESRRERHLVPRLYAQRETAGRFLRVGGFTPDAPGRVRMPRLSGGLSDTIMGVMAGSSDALRVGGSTPSMVPLHITPTRPGVVEVFRDGVLLYAQSVDVGLQTINTRNLPSGIYEVEVRLVEDGQLVSARNELVYKPSEWGDIEQRWRYAVYAGQQRSLFGSDSRATGDLATGMLLNYLAHPRLIVGTALQQVGSRRSLGASLDWSASEVSKIYLGASHGRRVGLGFDAQVLLFYREGTVSVGFGADGRSRVATSPGSHQRQRNGTITWAHRWDARTYLSAHAVHNEGGGVRAGTGIDLSLTHQRKLFGNDASVGFAVFDRPAGLSAVRRDRGVNLSLSLALGGGVRGYGFSAGMRSAQTGERDRYAAFSVRQQLNHSLLNQVGGGVTMDRHGIGLNGIAQMQHERFAGDAFMQRSSLNGGWTGGANLYSAMALGGGGLAMSGQPLTGTAEAGVIVDVNTDLPGAEIRAHDIHGGSVVLRPGRNFVPVTAYREGKLQFDFDATAAPSAVVQPSVVSYHLNKGGVDHQVIRVMKTVTVIGRLLDDDGEPLSGGRVVNHAGHAVTEADGLFALEVSEHHPQIKVRHAELGECDITLDPGVGHREGDVLMLGDLSCPADRPDHPSPRVAALPAEGSSR